MNKDSKQALIILISIAVLVTASVTIYYYFYKKPYICFHRTNLKETALYGAKHSTCLETDLTITNGILTLYHPPKPPTSFTLPDIVEIVNKNDLAIWIDSKNLITGNNCDHLSEYLQDIPLTPGKVMVEFPVFTDPLLDKVADCSDKIRSFGYYPAYYMPIWGGIQCARELKEDPKNADSKSCKKIRSLLQDISESGAFSDITFPYESLLLYETFEEAQNFTWSMWDVPESQLQSIDPKRFYMVILKRKHWEPLPAE